MDIIWPRKRRAKRWGRMALNSENSFLRLTKRYSITVNSNKIDREIKKRFIQAFYPIFKKSTR
jgi:hypothetical protein